MIPNAVASTGPYAGLWSHLKSIDHALERALDLTSTSSLTVLDRERLHALIQFLEGALSQNTSASPPQTGLLVHSQVSEPNYSSAIDLRERISAVPAFDNWRKTSKQGFEQKLQRLISEIRNFVNTPSPGLFPKNASHSEFEVLRAIIQSLLSDAEAALQY